VRLGALAYGARLDFDEVADMHPGRELRAGARTHARVRADIAVCADIGVLQVTEGLDSRRGADGHVSQDAIRADRNAVAEPDLALEDAVQVDRNVPSAVEGPAHVTA